MEIKCEDNLCVYWNNWQCILSTCRIDNGGMCMNFEYVDIPEKELTAYRKKHLGSYGITDKP